MTDTTIYDLRLVIEQKGGEYYPSISGGPDFYTQRRLEVKLVDNSSKPLVITNIDITKEDIKFLLEGE